MNAKESVAAYCKAQAEINKIEKSHEEQKKHLNERIKTCRSLLMDSLTTQNISCIEVYDTNETDPQYLRLKPAVPNTTISMEDIAHILGIINKDHLTSCAEKHNHDLPKMVSATIQTYAREQKKSASEKTSLSISSNRERGYSRDINETIPEETMQLAKDLLSARKELSNIKQKTSAEKKGSITIQKEVETQVKDALKATDPGNMTTRIHMMQGESEWVYYLRCKERERTQPLGIRKIITIIEDAVISTLNENGISREYNGTCSIDAHFWKSLKNKISHLMDQQSGETKTVSKISLDRGAPRNRKKI